MKKNLFAERMQQLVPTHKHLEVSQATGISIETLRKYKRPNYSLYALPKQKLVYKIEQHFGLPHRELWNLTPYQQKQPELPMGDVTWFDEASECTQEQIEALKMSRPEGDKRMVIRDFDIDKLTNNEPPTQQPSNSSSLKRKWADADKQEVLNLIKKYIMPLIERKITDTVIRLVKQKGL